MKKGFSLAETLIAIMIVGVVASLTVTSIAKGVNQSYTKSTYKKSYATIKNIIDSEIFMGGLGLVNGDNSVYQNKVNLFNTLVKHLDVQSYVDRGEDTNLVDQEPIPTADEFKSSHNSLSNYNSASTPWIVTEDGLAYTIINIGSNGSCAMKEDIEKMTFGISILANGACGGIIVDTNGLSRGPNKIEPQLVDSSKSLNENLSMQDLTGDRFFIFVGRDGVTAGNKKYMATARILDNLK